MSKISLMNVPFDDTYDNVIDFATANAQRTYFDSIVEQEFEDVTIVRELRTVRVNGNYNLMQDYNYCMYVNDIDDVDRIYYAFIRSARWAGIDCVEFELELDYYQTYMFSHTLGESFIERALVDRYTKLSDGSTIPNRSNLLELEQINLGDFYKVTEYKKIQYLKQNASESRTLYFMWVISTDNIGGFSEVGAPSQFSVLCLPFTSPVKQDLYFTNNNKPLADITEFYNKYAQQPATVSIFITRNLPVEGLNITGNIITDTGIGFLYDGDTKALTINLDYTSDMIAIDDFNITFTDSEVKLDCYPYTYYVLTINRGNEISIFPQYISNLKIFNVINVYYALSVGGIQKEGAAIDNYLADKKQYMSINNAISECPLITDAYINFLRNQKASFTAGLASGVVGNVLGAVGAGVSKNPVGVVSGIAGTATTIGQAVGNIIDIKNTPDKVSKVGNDYIFDIITHTSGITIYKYEVPKEVKDRLRRYFQAYGYAINELRKPNTKSRTTWDYIKTIGAQVGGNITEEVKSKLRNIYDHGVRIWHNPANYCNYDINNREVSLS